MKPLTGTALLIQQERERQGAPKSLDASELAKLLNGRTIGNEITKEEAKLAKDNNLVVVYGASDDLMELAGAIDDECGAYDGGSIYIYKNELLTPHQDCECPYCDYANRQENSVAITAIWDDGQGYAWRYETEIPHYTFDIMEDGEPWCQGIVFDLADAAR